MHMEASCIPWGWELRSREEKWFCKVTHQSLLQEGRAYILPCVPLNSQAMSQPRRVCWLMNGLLIDRPALSCSPYVRLRGTSSPKSTPRLWAWPSDGESRQGKLTKWGWILPGWEGQPYLIHNHMLPILTFHLWDGDMIDLPYVLLWELNKLIFKAVESRQITKYMLATNTATATITTFFFSYTAALFAQRKDSACFYTFQLRIHSPPLRSTALS